jgi:starch phosphorylase
MIAPKRDEQSSYGRLPTEIEGFESLAELALNLRWSWNHRADQVWRQIDPIQWKLTQNAWVILQTASRDKLEKLLADPSFRGTVDDLLRSERQAADTPGWFQQHHAQSLLSCVAYFSLEFMLSEALPIYSGGLGNVAGDQLKSASDLGVPVVGVGLLYQQGYFRQVIDKDGAQQAHFPYNDPGQLPITPVRRGNGEWLRLEIALHGYSIWLRAWQVKVGRVTLYLLDSNDPSNSPNDRAITTELYGGDQELRLRQEMVLGIGGWRLLAELGIQPEVCHLNEGHAAFAVLERARNFKQEAGLPFDAALAATRVGNLFTTHTAVAAGFDRFPPALIERYLGRYAEHELGIQLDDLLALGRQNPSDSSESFNMAYLAIRGSGAVNGVSQLHGQVSRNLFAPLFPHWPVDEVPVGYVTNGIHVSTWDSDAASELWAKACGEHRWLGTTETLEQKIRGVSDESLWQLRTAARESLVPYVRERLSRQLAVSDASPEEINDAKQLFDPEVLTLGFARRFATYKRPNLLLHDTERLLRLLTNPERPVQLILAGKAHPADQGGQALIEEWIRFIRDTAARNHVIFLGDYDMRMSEHLVHGIDVWLNTPRRPWEACGTSGMKVLVNGGLNFSELDGWWAEAYAPDLGWALGDGLEHGNDPGLDHFEAEMLYETLERQIVPEFYARGEHGIPTAWVARIRESMARLTPQFSANRAVREYTEKLYLPAADAYRLRTTDKGATGRKIVEWRHSLEQHWASLRLGEVKIESRGEMHEFEVRVWLNDLDPGAVRVEVYADSVKGFATVRQDMTRHDEPEGASSSNVYTASVSAARPASEYTVRVIPRLECVAIPLEEARILWQR